VFCEKPHLFFHLLCSSRQQQQPPPQYAQPPPQYAQNPPQYGAQVAYQQPVQAYQSYGQTPMGGGYQQPTYAQPPPSYGAQTAYAQPVNYSASAQPLQPSLDASKNSHGSKNNMSDENNDAHTMVAPVPGIAECKKLLEDKTEDELRKLLDDKAEMKLFLDTHPYIESHVMLKDSIVSDCQNLARTNLGKREDYEIMQVEITAEKDRLRNAQVKHNDVAGQCRTQAKSSSKEAQLERLGESADESEVDWCYPVPFSASFQFLS
jgi:hypothetical protein